MSLEQALAENTAALKALTLVFANQERDAVPPSTDAPATRAAKADTPASVAVGDSSAGNTTVAEPSASVADLKKEAFKVLSAYLAANKNTGGNAKVKALFADYGAKNITEVPDDKLADLIAAVEQL